MSVIWRTLSFIFTALLILTAHIFVINFFPFPFNQINIIIASLIFLSTINQSKKIIWLGLVVSYLSGLLSSTPFGIGMVATLISILAINWFQLNILTNRSGYMVFLSLLLGVAIYRILFVFFLAVNNYFSHNPALLYGEIIINAGWEILLSSVFVFLFYLLSSRFLKKPSPVYIKNN